MKTKSKEEDFNEMNYLRNLDEKTILMVLIGDSEVLTEVVDAYEPNINKLAEREVVSGNGQIARRTDETVKLMLKNSLMVRLTKFDPQRQERIRKNMVWKIE